MGPPFTIVEFDEEHNVVEIQYDGANAAKLAELDQRVTVLENENENDTTDSELAELEEDINSLNTLVQAQSSALTAEINDRTMGDLNLNESFTDELISQQQEYSSMIEAEAEARAQAILDEATARGAAIAESEAIIMTDVAILATTVEGMATELGAAQSSIIEVQDALVTETMARTAQYSAIQADYSGTNAALLEESVARSTEDEALAYQISIIEGSVGDNSAAILEEQIARVSADEAMASDITALTVEVSENTAAIATEAGIRAEADGDIYAKYSVKIDVNGHVSGFGLISTENDGVPYSEFIFTSDSFKIFNGITDIPPFEVVGGVVRMQNVIIGSAVIDNLAITTAKLDDEAVVTDKVTDNAITSRAGVSEDSYFELPYSAGGVITEVATLTFTGHGGYTEIDWFIPVWHNYNSNPYGYLYVHFLKDGVAQSIWNVSGGAWEGECYLGYVKKFVEPSLSGTHTYSIAVEAKGGLFYPMPRGISIVEYKK